VTVEVVGEEGRTAAASVIVRVRDDGLGCLAPLPGLPVEKPTALTLLHPLTRSPYGSGLSQAHEWSPGDSDALLAKDRPQPDPRRRPHRLHARTTRRSPPA
jgi:hypothetical protein